MKKLFFCFGLALLAGLVFIGHPQQAQAVTCGDDPAVAEWNKDYSINPVGDLKNTNIGRFSCGCTAPNREDAEAPARLNKLYDCSNGCSLGCPTGQKCFCQRLPDCEDIGGLCFKNGFTYANKNSEINGRKKTEFYPNYNTNIKYRCPSDTNITCYVPDLIPYTPPPEEPPEVVVIVEKKQQPAIPIIPSSCCKQIVPDIGDPQLNEYSLNHLVQVAINVYECILCVIGALILLALVVGAFVLMTSAGNEKLVGLGKQIITGAVIGGLIVFFSFLVVNFVVKALGAQFTNVQRVEINPQG